VSDNNSRAALALSIEIVLMRRGGPQYHRIIAKLENYYDCKIFDCFEHPEYLKAVISEVYPNDYHAIIQDLRIELDELASQKEIIEFLELLEK
jgi:hypothetical protein